jgi:hypothetical protein
MIDKFRRRAIFVAILMLLFLLALAIAAVAQEPAYTADRPGFSNAPYSVGEDKLALESGFGLNYSASYNQYTEANVLRMGATDWFETRVGVDMGTHQGAAGHNYVGVQDINVGAKIAFIRNVSCLPDMAVLGTCYLPEIGNTHYTPHLPASALYLLANKNIGKFSILGNLGAVWDTKVANGGYFLNPYANTYTVQGNYILNLDLSVSKQLDIFAEVYGFFSVVYAPLNGVDIGLVVTITPTLYWDLSGGVTYVQGINNSFINTGVAWRFSDKTN